MQEKGRGKSFFLPFPIFFLNGPAAHSLSRRAVSVESSPLFAFYIPRIWINLLKKFLNMQFLPFLSRLLGSGSARQRLFGVTA